MNNSDENYLVTLLESVVHLRKNLKLELLARDVERAWITECVKELFPPGTTLGTKSDTVALLPDVFAMDVVHFMQECYFTMAQSLVKHLENHFTGISTTEGTASVSVSGAGRSFYWKGFCSPAGSVQLQGLTMGNRSHGSNRLHLYNRGWERSGNRRN